MAKRKSCAQWFYLLLRVVVMCLWYFGMSVVRNWLLANKKYHHDESMLKPWVTLQHSSQTPVSSSRSSQLGGVYAYQNLSWIIQENYRYRNLSCRTLWDISGCLIDVHLSKRKELDCLHSMLCDPSIRIKFQSALPVPDTSNQTESKTQQTIHPYRAYTWLPWNQVKECEVPKILYALDLKWTPEDFPIPESITYTDKKKLNKHVGNAKRVHFWPWNLCPSHCYFTNWNM